MSAVHLSHSFSYIWPVFPNMMRDSALVRESALLSLRDMLRISLDTSAPLSSPPSSYLSVDEIMEIRRFVEEMQRDGAGREDREVERLLLNECMMCIGNFKGHTKEKIV